jgi:hypothetical protein
MSKAGNTRLGIAVDSLEGLFEGGTEGARLGKLKSCFDGMSEGDAKVSLLGKSDGMKYPRGGPMALSLKFQ